MTHVEKLCIAAAAGIAFALLYLWLPLLMHALAK